MPDMNEPVPPAEPSERFITLLNATHARLLGFLRVMLGNNADAEDVLQRASLTMWRKFGEFDPTLDFFAWASSFAFYEAKNFQRVAARSKLHFDDELMARLAEERTTWNSATPALKPWNGALKNWIPLPAISCVSFT